MTAMREPVYLDPYQPECYFPDVSLALTEPNGLLAVGGNLTEATLLNAYRHGIFPWYSDGQPILWWSPNPRAVLFPDRLKISRSLRKKLRQRLFDVSLDRTFGDVIEACAKPRGDGLGTWITEEMKAAYIKMHLAGHAHSAEVWCADKLVGGLYGISIGQAFFGESMFSSESDASKVALAYLVAQLKQWRFSLIDCQIGSAHLARLGAREIERSQFIDHLDRACLRTSLAPLKWELSPSLHDSW